MRSSRWFSWIVRTPARPARRRRRLAIEPLEARRLLTADLSVSDPVVVEGNSGTRQVQFTVALSEAPATNLTVDYATGRATSLRFFGNGTGGIDRVLIPLDGPARPVDVGAADFTIEWWMRANLAENTGTVTTGNDGWITGNIILDRDIWGPGDFGDWGVSLGNGRLAFGVNNGASGQTIVGTTNVADGQWHHVAVTRRGSDGLLTIFVDGRIDAQGAGPTGNLSYRDGRSTAFAADPYLVLGAEKHDAGSGYPSYSGWLDELRISTSVRYTQRFTAPVEPLGTDAATVGLYRFDEGAGTVVRDSSGAAGGPSHGTIAYGGAPAGPLWSAETPFHAAFAGIDYTAATGTLTFTPLGPLTQTVSVTIQGDAVIEASERFVLRLSNVSGGTIADGEGTATIANDDLPPLVATTINSSLSSPIAVVAPPDGTNRLFVVQRGGQIRIIENGTLLGTAFLDISARPVLTTGEGGLLGLAFHPDYAVPGAAGNGRFYVHYTTTGVSGNALLSRISEFTVSAGNPNLADAGSERILLAIDQPQSNHNGGDLAFGPDDKLLYIGMGDGGAANDTGTGHIEPGGNAQNLTTLLGKMLRIDPLGTDGPGGQYGIPATNPFVGAAGVPGDREEIYAYGLRNPFRYAFDDGSDGRRTGDRLFVGDVGQGAWEEIDLVVNGGNYGWRLREGFVATPTGGVGGAAPGAIDPITVYPNPPGGTQAAVIGGHVYRGAANPELVGTYLFADYLGQFYSLQENNGVWPAAPTAATVTGSVTGIIFDFGTDGAGELYYVRGTAVQRFGTANQAPELDPSGQPFLTGYDVTSVANPGTLVRDLLARGAAGDPIVDIDPSAQRGIAVTAVDASNGTWEFSIDGGGSWSSLGTPSAAVARLLAADDLTRVRFVRNASYAGTVAAGLTFRAWDRTSGTQGGTADTTTHGGTSAFSTAEETASITITNAAPRITGVFARGPVSGTTWTSDYTGFLAGQGLGGPLGFRVSSGANQLAALPWVNLDTLAVTFSEGVNVTSGALALLGAPEGPSVPGVLGFSYDSGTFTATWTFAAGLVANKYLLHFASAAVTDAQSAALDGDWTTSVSTFSGDGAAGGDFSFRFLVVPGDTNGDAATTLSVTNADVLQAKQALQTDTSAGAAYLYRRDVNASGAITNADVLLVKQRLQTSIFDYTDPVPPPPAPGGEAAGEESFAATRLAEPWHTGSLLDKSAAAPDSADASLEAVWLDAVYGQWGAGGALAGGLGSRTGRRSGSQVGL